MTLLSDKLSLIGLLVILLEVALVVLVVSPEQARRARVAEQETATAVFGAPLALVIGALTDALVERKTALLNSEITNAVFYHSAKGVLFWLLLLPVLIAISPVTIRSTALVVWGVSVPLLLWVGARNVQEM